MFRQKGVENTNKSNSYIVPARRYYYYMIHVPAKVVAKQAEEGEEFQK